MKKIWEWLKTSNRYKHLVGGMAIGLMAEDWYCAGLAGVGIASALEYKDKAHGGAWDWLDWDLTIAGVIVGYGLRWMIV